MGWGRRRNGEQHNVYLCVCLLPQKTVIIAVHYLLIQTQKHILYPLGDVQICVICGSVTEATVYKIWIYDSLNTICFCNARTIPSICWWNTQRSDMWPLQFFVKLPTFLSYYPSPSLFPLYYRGLYSMKGHHSDRPLTTHYS